ncbi:MAG TPA: type 4a pilus biogenesis protein PilO [Terriglobales bacterium]|nr:type 4a pilus biogenesis protein PilO [Terriglobales bacterium]
MAGLREMPVGAQLAIALVIAALVGGGLIYGVVKPMDDTNKQNQVLLDQKKADNDRLRQYERDLPGLERQIASLQQQLDIQKTIVPDEKETPAFMTLMQDTASSAGIEIRRYTPKTPLNREFYTEVPYDMDIDGPYYAVLNFFEKVSKLQRIINVSDLQIAGVKHSGDAKVKATYTYSPNETVVANCTTTTFFSHDAAPAAAPAPAAGKK